LQSPVTSQLTIKPKRLSIEDIKSLSVPIKIENDLMIIETSLKGHKLRQPVKVPLKKVMEVGEKGLVTYALSLANERPKLIEFLFNNQSLIRLAKHFLRHCSGSVHSLYGYTNTVDLYSRWASYSPDLIIADVKPEGNIPDPQRVQNHVGYLEDFVSQLQDQNLTPGRVYQYAKHIRTFYRVNGIKIELSEPLSRRVTCKDRAPKPEELTHLLDIADLREKVIVSLLALSGLREDTLSKLKYYHIKEDYEVQRTPIHVHVEVEITKGKYADYDTFIAQESADYLRLYIEGRRKGSPDGRDPAENIEDNSPLIRSKISHIPGPVGAKQIGKIVHALYAKAGLLKTKHGRMYDVRTHSLRKFFKTQLLSLGVQESYVDYMMGHVVDTYHDVQSLGIDFLRRVYSASGLSIKPKTRISKIDAIKEIIRAYGMDPEQVLTREALNQPATTQVSSEEYQNNQLQTLSKALRELIRKDTTDTLKTVQMRTVDSGPAGN
jgi:site-specific recombinase XerD